VTIWLTEFLCVQTGNAGKWKTPHQLAKIAALEYNTVNPGDQGVWVTCARQREVKASREIQILFAEVCVFLSISVLLSYS